MNAPRILDLGAVHMRPTSALQAARLAASPTSQDLTAVRSHVAGGEVSLRVVEAPGLKGKWLAAIVETWPNGHFEILGACHADSAAMAACTILPHFESIVAARKG